MAVRHTARGIILHQDNLLLMERWRGRLHYFSVPGGGIEPGETPEQTVVRELAEETGCVVRPERELYRLRFHDGSESVLFLCTYIAGEPHLPADAPEAQEGPNNRFNPRWVPLGQLADLPFLVWKPVQVQLLQDLQHGFRDSVQLLAPEA